ncbi:hypothetical protein [Clostridium botulinum]|uniref:Uncharacterized protein n=1 Tax=Clostridium botulinum TaxID=1491 RepID=A0A846J617_CLOBO|nr:hypothetical protein [Clostridium botulinum]ACA57385.1 hypothetical protein CLK_A0030 [Clostridium botulinum A3 str. Loch Maree]NFE18654.1 hypothetical protein [Clostridium botulinum]NFH65560.1 hypothetical protein [Clostridium botulinum]NFJ09418.1 hypothetical protein [Clostridium botulinum]NFK16760.1 hypothetical protein [Clostridium botulinum]
MKKEVLTMGNTSINCPYCGYKHSLSNYIFLEDNEIKGKFHIQCNKCNKFISVKFKKKDKFIVEVFESKNYIELIEAIEDLDGVNSYVIFSDTQIPKQLIKIINERGYIGISIFECVCNLYGVAFEEFREE